MICVTTDMTPLNQEGPMTKKVSAFLIAACLLFAAEARAMSGNDWRQLPEVARLAYVIGVVDTWGQS